MDKHNLVSLDQEVNDIYKRVSKIKDNSVFDEVEKETLNEVVELLQILTWRLGLAVYNAEL